MNAWRIRRIRAVRCPPELIPPTPRKVQSLFVQQASISWSCPAEWNRCTITKISLSSWISQGFIRHSLLEVPHDSHHTHFFVVFAFALLASATAVGSGCWALPSRNHQPAVLSKNPDRAARGQFSIPRPRPWRNDSSSDRWQYESANPKKLLP